MMISSSDLWLCKQNPWYFLSNFFMTFDELDPLVPTRKPYPSHWTVFKDLLDRFESDLQLPGNRAIYVPKSRQLMVSWTVMGYLLNKCMYRDRTTCFVQSKRREDSEYQIERIKKAYEYLVPELQALSPLSKSMERQPVAGLYFANGSSIQALPMGGDIIRSKVPTILFSDEAAFQDDFEEVIKAAKACTKLHISVSSPHPGTFQKIIEDTYGL